MPLESAIAMATLYPAEYIGVSDSIGQLKKGHRADLAHFDSNFHVHNVWLAGNQIKKDAQ
ncbi:amidohydrolase family protein [bacterium]|nr:amidohydrolase family protein [bacterium]